MSCLEVAAAGKRIQELNSAAGRERKAADVV